MSDKQGIFNPDHNNVYQDMTHPMSHYFIASSHNTYLTGNQVVGSSKVDAYADALTRGCRCVELDCWDGPDGEPIIYHGYTLTSDILLRDVIIAVKKNAFTTSPYPVILSLENHCSLEQQKTIVKHMTGILGDMLWYPKEELNHTPSPEELKGKIIIKGYKISDDKTTDGNGKEISPDLSRITSMNITTFEDPKQALTAGGFFAIFNLSERRMRDLLDTNPGDMNLLSQQKLLRVYPNATRFTSSNFRPVSLWNHGCQILALNYQSDRGPMQLNHGKFMDNGQCGYILKPDILLSEKLFGIADGTLTRSNKSKILNITINRGHHIPKPNGSTKGEIIDPYVEIYITGAQTDNKDYWTKTVHNNGLNPEWNETFSFKIRVPELAMLRFVVKDDDWIIDDFIGYYCLPVNSVQEGHCHFPLYNRDGEEFPGALVFVHVSIETVS